MFEAIGWRAAELVGNVARRVAAVASGVAEWTESLSPNKRSSNRDGTKTRDELYELAKKADIPGRSGMSKAELAKALAK